MRASNTPVSYLLVTLSAVTLLYAEGQLPDRAIPEPTAITGPETVHTTVQGVDDTTDSLSIEHRSNTQPWNPEKLSELTTTRVHSTDTIPVSNDVTNITTDPSRDESTERATESYTQYPSTTRTQYTAASEITAPTYHVDKHLKLICPNTHADRFLSTSWFLQTGRGMIGLYRIDQKGLVFSYKDWYNILFGTNVTHNVTDAKVLSIHLYTCAHTATYWCKRSGRVGYKNEVYSFSVANCTMFRTIDPRFYTTDAYPGNTSSYMRSSIPMLAIGLIVRFICIY